MNKNKFYVTTPIYYVTAAPHLGSLYSTLLADVAARYHSMMGKNVFFLVGTDEHGQKIAEAAKKVNKHPQDFVDGFVDSYSSMWKLYNIDYSKFIRTTDKYHQEAVQTWISRLIAQKDIYKDTYTGWYCTPCETFVTQKDQSEDDKANSKEANAEISCPSCLRPTNEISEECYFFRLSAYQDKLLSFFEKHPDFISPKERAQEVISFVKGGLKDLSISRSTISWGIPFPGDSKHVTYVWADALNNYISAVGYGSANGEKELHAWWPADLQVLGKDIVRFHAVYWPAFLMASELAQPKKLLVHGWIKMGDQKMSKSLGNAIDPKSLADKYGVDEIRYYLMRKMAITQDSQFSIADIEQSINSELADDLGNLLNRCSTLCQKYDYLSIQAPSTWSDETKKLQEKCHLMIKDSLDMIEQGFFYRAINNIWEYINITNAYFHANEPWKQAASNKEKFQETIAATVYSLRAIGIMLWPIMPEKMETLLSSIGYSIPMSSRLTHTLNPEISKPTPSLSDISFSDNLVMKKIDTLFKKMEKTMDQSTEQIITPVEETNFISIDDFAKVDLRVGTIFECEIVEKSDKLLKLQVDFGSFGKKQIFSGMRKFLSPQDLIGKQGVFVVNFKPRNIMGMPSEGMMLTSDGAVLNPSKVIENGSKVV
ncbi:MAG: methionine--tRNA ligase [Candidatus Dependentiae bacterium]|nr:methionine--tRNA ligase [Candidatus Dependentiae bacterium]